MKFLLLALAVFGVAKADVNHPKSINEALDFIKAAIPSDKIVEIVRGCSNDPEVKALQLFLRDESPAIVEKIRADPKISEMFVDKKTAGVVFDWLIDMVGFSGSKPTVQAPIAPKSCGGWRGVREQIQKIFTLTDVKTNINTAYDTSPEFATMWDRMEGNGGTIQGLLGNPTIADLVEQFEDLGMDISIIREALTELFDLGL